MGSRLAKNSNKVRKRIENHTFDNEEGEEYEGSNFGGFSDYMRRKKIKLQNLDAELRSQSRNNVQIFRGIVVHVNGYTRPPLSVLHRLVVSHGGGFLQYLDTKTSCTHIIAGQLTPKKKAEFAKYRIVKPAWIVDSVDAGRLLPWDSYRLVDEGAGQKVLGFENGQIVSQANTQQQSYRDQMDNGWQTSQVKNVRHSLGGSTKSAEIAVSPAQKDVSNSEEGSRKNELQGPKPALLQVRDEMADELDLNDQYLVEDGEASAFRAGSPRQATDAGDDMLPVNDATVSSESTSKKRPLTAEEHNAILLQNPHMAKSSTANPDFLNQYYRESRLHHLSTWKAELKAQLQARALEKSSSQKARTTRPAGARRYIMHVDFDSFFAAVSLRQHPHLSNQPVVVAHGSGPGSEIASCNYPAREFGVKNGMWMKSALEMCPTLKVLPYDFKAYEEASRHFYDSILNVEGLVQSISIDEALIDISVQCIKAGGSDGKQMVEGSVYREQSKANELAAALRNSVKDKTGCDVSVGIGGNILLAKVALRKAKPAGQHQILPDDILNFIGELKVTDLPGVAHSLGKKLEELGVTYAKDIRTLTKERLITALGPKTGEKLWDYSRGIDKVEVGDQVVRKSVSAEINWGIRFVTQQQAEDFVQCLCDELHKRLLENAVKGKQLTMKIMRKAADAGMDPPKNLGHGKCDTFNKSVVLGIATNDKSILGKEAVSILRSYGFPPGELRGLGVQMQKLEPIKQVVAANTSLLDSSQRRLTFKKPHAQANTDPSSVHTAFTSDALSSNDVLVPDISIENIDTPEKPKTTKAPIATIETKKPNEKPLNMLGTQFMVPSQVDPAVLAELPEDIRSKLAPQRKSVKDFIRSSSPAVGIKSRSHSPHIDEEFDLPSLSQLDPENLAALPEDMREEVLAYYRTSAKQNATTQNQSLLPQSPRKIRSTNKKGATTPTKKQSSTTFYTRGSQRSKIHSSSTLMQSNFMSMQGGAPKSVPNEDLNSADISESFLDELPEEIRLEILDEQRRGRMKARFGLDIGTSRRKPKHMTPDDDLERGQQTLKWAPRDPIPSFTSRKLSSLPDLRSAMSAWVQEFSGTDGQGPFAEDTSALASYLSRVIVEERDMAKAVAVVDWLTYLVGDWPFPSDGIRASWTSTITFVQSKVQEAVKSRGLPSVVFDRL